MKNMFVGKLVNTQGTVYISAVFTVHAGTTEWKFIEFEKFIDIFWTLSILFRTAGMGKIAQNRSKVNFCVSTISARATLVPSPDRCSNRNWRIRWKYFYKYFGQRIVTEPRMCISFCLMEDVDSELSSEPNRQTGTKQCEIPMSSTESHLSVVSGFPAQLRYTTANGSTIRRQNDFSSISYMNSFYYG